jgi:para-aminobenzoate synthetase component 1
MVAKNIKVTKFRYVEKIKAGEKELLQVSSEIVGEIDKNWISNWKQIILKLLPAGSISGTPKKKTLEIIKNNENYKRGFYTGIFGIIDEKKGILDSAVIIRYIENQNGKMVYKSGGGITIDSNVESEYRELTNKIYIP